jgi:hypothetical protein
MDNLFIRSISGEALRAELHRLAEAVNNRLARAASTRPTSTGRAGTSALGRMRNALADLGRPAQADCPDCV